MSDDNLPTVVAESEMVVLGHKFRVLVLSNGARIVPAEDLERFTRVFGVPSFLKPEKERAVSERRLLLIAVESNRVTCGPCRLKRRDRAAYCSLTGLVLSELSHGYKRTEQCLEAERLAAKGETT